MEHEKEADESAMDGKARFLAVNRRDGWCVSVCVCVCGEGDLDMEAWALHTHSCLSNILSHTPTHIREDQGPAIGSGKPHTHSDCSPDTAAQ